MRLQLQALFVVVAGCASHFPLPMTANELVRYDSGPALIAYLGQPDASPTVCDLRAQGPHMPAFTPEIRLALVDGLVGGALAPGLWRRCVDLALAGLPVEQVHNLFDDVMLAYARMLKDSDLQGDPEQSQDKNYQ